MRTSALLVVVLLGFAFVANAARINFVATPANNGKYIIPTAPDANYTAIYTCVVFDLAKLHPEGRSWLIRANALTDNRYVHHAVGYAIPEDSSLLMGNGFLNGIEHGDMIPNCLTYRLRASYPGPSIMYATQHGVPPMDLIRDFDDDDKSQTGYPYGIPIGTQTTLRWLLVQGHYHNPDHIEGLETRVRYEFEASTVAPDEPMGVLISGTFNHELLVLPPGESTVSALMPSNVPYNPFLAPPGGHISTAEAYMKCFPPPYGALGLRAGAFEQVQFVAGVPAIKLLASGLHAHGRQEVLKTWISPYDQAFLSGLAPLDECVSCKHGVSNYHILNEVDPVAGVVLRAGDGILMECTYQNNDATDAYGGYGTNDEMCIGFQLYAPAPAAGRTLGFTDPCNVVNDYKISENGPNPGASLAVPPAADPFTGDVYCDCETCGDNVCVNLFF